MTKAGCKDASSDIGQVDHWWTTNPTANIGVATGGNSGLFVVDLDGDEGIREFEAIHGTIDAPTVASGGGGQHIWFACPDGERLANGAKLHGINVDVRGDGGYIIAPPSQHPSGRMYEWTNELNGTLPVLPESLHKWITSSKGTGQKLQFRGDFDEAPGVGEGQRHAKLIEYAGRHLSYGEPGTIVLDKALQWNQRCTPPMTENEVFTAVRSLEEKHHAQAGDDQQASADSKAKTEGDDDKQKGKTQAVKLVELCTGVELFHDPEGVAYVAFETDGHNETHRVRSKAFRLWMSRQYWNLFQSTPGTQAIQDAIAVLEGHAVFSGGQEPVFLRIAQVGYATVTLGDADKNASVTRKPSVLPSGDAGDTDDAKIPTVFKNVVIDLGWPDWSVVVVDSSGWSVERQSPVRFRRSKGMRSLPKPVSGGSVAMLKPFLNVKDEDWPLVAGWLLGCFHPSGPYAVLTVNGEAGSAKSTSCRTLRGFVDPNEVPLRRPPRNEEDLVIGAKNSHVVTLENVSGIGNWLSDALCCLSTGSGFSTRTHYENEEETLFQSCRPIMINGIEEMATRGDLLDRSVPITLETIPDDQRLPEDQYWRRINEVSGHVFGGLLDAVSQAVRELPHTTLEELPRMADFARWVTAGETALGLQPGEFMDAYNHARGTANDHVIESSLVATAVIKLVEKEGEWIGTATELRSAAEVFVTEKDRNSKRWPKDATRMGGSLRRVAPNLRKAGVSVEFPQRNKKNRNITLRLEKCWENSVTSVTSVTTSELPSQKGDTDENASVTTASPSVTNKPRILFEC